MKTKNMIKLLVLLKMNFKQMLNKDKGNRQVKQKK